MIWAGLATFILGAGASASVVFGRWVCASVSVPSATYFFYLAYSPIEPRHLFMLVTVFFALSAFGFFGMSAAMRQLK
jgi:hypothetical protein